MIKTTIYKPVRLWPLLWICFWLLPDVVLAQKEPIRFKSMLSVGLITGQQEFGASLDAAAGIGSTHFFAGAGLGYDSYGQHSLPVYFSARYYPGFMKHIFGFGKLGYNAGLEDMANQQWGYYEEQDNTGGLYAGAGLGFFEKISKNSSIFFSVGYSLKKMNITLSNPPTCESCYSNSDTYHYQYRRIIFRTGIMF